MLYAIDHRGVKPVRIIPHEHQYLCWRRALPEAEHRAIVEELARRIEGAEIHTSSWIPGADWSGTVFEPIYKACRADPEASAKFFGLILWTVMMEHPEPWSFGRYRLNDVPIQGLTYFRIHL